jgi:hypothetical protein
MSTGTVLGSVRVRGSAADPLMARTRLATMLAAADLHPPGLAPSALLMVRRLRDPLPGALALDGRVQRPPAAWEHAFSCALEGALAAAARPAKGPVPAAANAVLFADRAELLACLARDALDGTAVTRWWWRGALAGAAGALAGAAHAWSQAPRHVPAALELVAAWSLAPAFARALPAAAAGELTTLVGRAFALPDASGAVSARRHEPPPPAPWRELVPEAADPGLDRSQQALLGVALALRRAPALARTLGFVRATRAWERAQDRRDAGRLPPPSPSRSRELPPAPVPAATPARDGAGLVPERAPADRLDRPPRRAVTRPPHEARSASGAATGAIPRQPHPASPPGAAPRGSHEPAAGALGPQPPPAGAANAAHVSMLLPPAQPQVAPRVAPPAGGGPAPAPRPAEPQAPAHDAAAVEGRPPASAAVERDGRHHVGAGPVRDRAEGILDTGLGGVFYLLNLALQLDLYGDFTRPREPGIALSPWELVELLGVRILGERPADPLWELLTSLAGRPPGAPPGRDFHPSPAWRVPPAWLEPLDHDGTWRWSAAAGVLRVVHPAGFAVLAVPRCSAAPAAQLRRELSRLASVARHAAATPAARVVRDELVRLASAAGAPVRATLRREPTRPLARWNARLATYAGARLRHVLALDAGEPTGETLIRRRARVFVSATHVDVVLKLAELPIRVRIAGLDRTPGWIPATGRFVALHFE